MQTTAIEPEKWRLSYAEFRRDSNYTKPLPTDAEFFSTVIDLTAAGMETVHRCVQQGNLQGARDAYLGLIGSGAKKRFYFEPLDVAGLSEFANKYFAGDDQVRFVIEEADRIVNGDIPLYKSKRVVFENGAYDWNGWLYDSSQYQLFLTRFLYTKFLSRAYCITGNEKYSKCFNAMMNHFLDDCPTPRDGRFCIEHCTWDTLTVGVRMFTLPEAFITFFTSEFFLPEVKMKMIKSFYEHGHYVRSHHALHGNHACMELRGLVQIALLLPELKVSKEWQAYGLAELPKYFTQNVYDDGVQFEASPSYHVVVMRDIYELVPLFARLAIKPAFGYRELLEKMHVVLMQLLSPTGLLPCFGDTVRTDDSGDIFYVGDVMSIGALIFGKPEFKFLGHKKFPFSCLWTHGVDAAADYDRLETQPPTQTAVSFSHGGYLVSRQSWDKNAMYFAMRAGVGIGGHAHSDALSFVAWANGREVLVDSGMGLYEWNVDRKYLLSTRAHNTVVVDHQDQHVRNLHWGPPPTAPCKIWDFKSNEQFDYFFASHYGYTRYDDPVIHSRKVLFVKNRYWLIVDLLEAREEHLYELYFHLPPGEAICDWEKRRIRTNDPASNLLLVFSEDDGVQTKLESGLLYERAKHLQKPVVKRAIRKAGGIVFATVALPYKGQQAPEVKVKRLSARKGGRELAPHEATALKISGNGWEDEVCIYHGNVRTNAYLDHTGNVIEDSLLRASCATKELKEIEFSDGIPCSDVVLRSQKQASPSLVE